MSVRLSSVASPSPVIPASVWTSTNIRSRQRTETLWIAKPVILTLPSGAAAWNAEAKGTAARLLIRDLLFTVRNHISPRRLSQSSRNALSWEGFDRFSGGTANGTQICQYPRNRRQHAGSQA